MQRKSPKAQSKAQALGLQQSEGTEATDGRSAGNHTNR